MTAANIGAIVALAWEEVMDKYRALEGDVFAFRRRKGIRRGMWRGVAYVKMWDFRTGETKWREL